MTSTSCVAVGVSSPVLTWNGWQWDDPSIDWAPGDRRLAGASCVVDFLCMAVGTVWSSATNSQQTLGLFGIVPQPTTITLSSSSNPANVGDVVTFTATLSSDANGTVSFSDENGDWVGCRNEPVRSSPAGTVATCQTSFNVPLTYSIRADYSGDDRFTLMDSWPPLKEVVQGTPTTVSVDSSLNPSTYGDAVTFTATVSSGGSGGSVWFQDNGNDIDGCTNVPVTVSPAGTIATCRTSSLEHGKHLINARYVWYSAAISPYLEQIVQKIPTSISASPALVDISGARLTLFTLGASLWTRSSKPLAGQPLTFTAGSTMLCEAVATGSDGSATCDVSGRPDLLIAVINNNGYGVTYSPDPNSNYLGSSGSAPLAG